MSEYLNNLTPKEPELPKDDNRSMAEIFEQGLPKTLRMNHYELSKDYPKYTPTEWRKYLKDNERFIMIETAAIVEADARKALERLGSGMIRTGDATAIRQLLDRSEQINQSINGSTKYITTFLPDPNGRKARSVQETIKRNRDIASIFYPAKVRAAREAKGEMVTNVDGTIHFPKLANLQHIDKVYMFFHNPKNAEVRQMGGLEEEWQ